MFTRIGAAAFKKDLGNTLELCRILNNPEKRFKSIHIAGTNGKGSTSHMLASILQQAGYKTGLYTSPHLRDFRERIRIDGTMISEQEVIQFTDHMEDAIARVQPSFFELGVAMAFDHFARHQVDIAVIETGMGGRLDSTNVILPELSLITSIGLDHMEFLGTDLATIAGEKAGIIKKGSPVVISWKQEETENVFRKKAEELDVPLFFASDKWILEKLPGQKGKTRYRAQRNGGPELILEPDLPGSYQRFNLPGVLEAWYQLKKQGWNLDEGALLSGLSSVQEQTGLMGRWQTLSHVPHVICDVGHNEDGIREVLAMLEQEDYAQLHFVIGMVSDKETDKILKLLPHNALYYFCQASIPRALPVEVLQERALAAGLHGEAFATVKEAYETAKSRAANKDLVFVGGSTFVVAEVV